MFNELFFFMYIFAGFAGALAILMAILLIKHWSSGNKELLSAIRNFMICTALIDALYFYFDYDMLINGEYGSNGVLRVLDVGLFIWQVYFWSAYMRKKSMRKDLAGGRLAKGSLAFIVVMFIISVVIYGFFMTEYYYVNDGSYRNIAIAAEIVLGTVLTGITLCNLKYSLAEIVQKKCRRLVILISLTIMINGIWNAVIVVFLLTGDLGTLIQKAFDPTSVFLFITNVFTIFLILSEDFSALFRIPEKNEREEDDIACKFDYIAETHFLTEREREILELAYEKMTNPEIAEKLGISKYTVKNHMHNIFEKLDVSTRTDLRLFVDREK